MTIISSQAEVKLLVQNITNDNIRVFATEVEELARSGQACNTKDAENSEKAS